MLHQCFIRQGWSLSRIQRCSELIHEKPANQSESALIQHWISAVHYLKNSQQCLLFISENPFSHSKNNRRYFRSDLLRISADSEEISSEALIFKTGRLWLSLKQSWPSLKSFISGLLISGQKLSFNILEKRKEKVKTTLSWTQKKSLYAALMWTDTWFLKHGKFRNSAYMVLNVFTAPLKVCSISKVWKETKILCLSLDSITAISSLLVTLIASLIRGPLILIFSKWRCFE